MAIDRDELHLAENPAVELHRRSATPNTYVAADYREPERRSFNEPTPANRPTASLKRLNPWSLNSNVTKSVKAVTQFPAAPPRAARRSAPRSPTESRWRRIAVLNGRSHARGSSPADTR